MNLLIGKHSPWGSNPQVRMLGLLNWFLNDEPRQSILELYHGEIFVNVIHTTRYENIF